MRVLDSGSGQLRGCFKCLPRIYGESIIIEVNG